jgi:polyhydroxybutyrate depolymerase
MRLASFAAAALFAAAACSDDRPAAVPTDAAPEAVAPPGQDGATPPGEDAGPDAAPPGPSFVVTDETLDVSGQARSFTLVVPASYDASRSYPLVVVFHGDANDGPSFRLRYQFENASRDDAIVVYPSGMPHWHLYEPVGQNPDIPFVEALIDDLVSRYSIDRARVFANGWSKGGFFVNQFACRRSGVFRAISAHAGGAPNEPDGAGTWPNGYVKCNEQQTGIAALISHGASDSVVTVGSGDFAAMYWAYVNGCGDKSTRTATATAPAPCTQHAGCPAGRPVVWCEIPELGHRLWSEGASASWAFFQGLGP